MNGDPAGAVSGATRPGCLVAVVGPSGAGKDTLLDLVLDRLQDDPRFVRARRTITRETHAADEDHDTMLPAAFNAARARGAFCLAWNAHGLGYGLPASLTDDVARGRTVVANLSRRVLGEAVSRFPRLAIVEITAPRHVLMERIAARGRETPAEIAARLDRRAELVVPAGTERFHRVNNVGTPESGAAALHDWLVSLNA